MAGRINDKKQQEGHDQKAADQKAPTHVLVCKGCKRAGCLERQKLQALKYQVNEMKAKLHEYVCSVHSSSSDSESSEDSTSANVSSAPKILPLQALRCQINELEAEIKECECLVPSSSSSDSESSDDSNSANVSSAPKIISSTVGNNEKKPADRKKRRRGVKNLMSPKNLAVPKMTKPEQENLVTSTLAADASDSDQSC